MPISPNRPSPIYVPKDPRKRDVYEPGIKPNSHSPNHDSEQDSDRYATSTMIPAVFSPPSVALRSDEERVGNTASSEQIRELVVAINSTPLNVELLKKLKFVFNSNDFNQRGFPNCWAVAVLKSLMETKAGVAILNYMIKEFYPDRPFIQDTDESSEDHTCQEDFQPRYTVRTPTLDDDFFQGIKHLVTNVLSEQSGEPYKAIIQGIMQMFHQTKSSYFKHRNPIPFLNKFIFTEKVPVDISLEKAMSKGWSTPHLIYRLFKNLTNEIFVIQSTSDEDKINFVLDQIRLNPGYHVAFASFKKNLHYYNQEMLAGQPLPKYDLHNKHAYSIHSVTDSHVVLINPWHNGTQIILERSEFTRLFDQMSAAILPKDIKSYDSINLSNQTPIHVAHTPTYLSPVSRGFYLSSVFKAFQPLTKIIYKDHEFFVGLSQHGPILHDCHSQKPLTPITPTSDLDQMNFSSTFLDHEHFQIDVNSYQIDPSMVFSIGFYGGNLTFEAYLNGELQTVSNSKEKYAEDEDVTVLENLTAYMVAPHIEFLRKDKTYPMSLEALNAPFAIRLIHDDGVSREFYVYPQADSVKLQTHNDLYHIGTTHEFSCFVGSRDGEVDTRANGMMRKYTTQNGIILQQYNGKFVIATRNCDAIMYQCK